MVSPNEWIVTTREKDTVTLRGAISFFSFLVSLAATGVSVGGQSTSHRLGTKEASKLVNEGIRRENSGANIHVVSNPYDQDFIYFQATWANPVGSPVIGNFAVNPWTGDVWNTAGCEHLSSPSLKKEQAGIRKRFGLTKEEYAKFHARRPLCGSD